MHTHFHVRHWIVWWLYFGAVCATIAVVNILAQNFTRADDEIVWTVSLIFWILGGLVCYALESADDNGHPASASHLKTDQNRAGFQREWHPASDFMLPGGRKSLLPPRR